MNFISTHEIPLSPILLKSIGFESISPVGLAAFTISLIDSLHALYA
jgi:hypothetical protein